MSDSVVVAIDGTSGSGKSSTARGVATRLGLRYLDTGAQFRAMTVWLLRHGVDVEDAEAVAAAARRPRIESGTDPQAPSITVDGEDVAAAVRSDETTTAVSAVAAVPEVRRVLLDLQRDTIGAGGIVVEGRDIGSVVAPEAEVKVYLTAEPGARSERRRAEAGAGSRTATVEDLARRDRLDSTRAAAPLIAADAAVRIDTTAFTLEQVIAQVVALVEAAR